MTNLYKNDQNSWILPKDTFNGYMYNMKKRKRKNKCGGLTWANQYVVWKHKDKIQYYWVTPSISLFHHIRPNPIYLLMISLRTKMF